MDVKYGTLGDLELMLTYVHSSAFSTFNGLTFFYLEVTSITVQWGGEVFGACFKSYIMLSFQRLDEIKI